jgi:hypothetical protein
VELWAYPNPLNSLTTITTNNSAKGEISTFDIAGRIPASLYAENGRAVWDSKGFSSGIYFAKLMNDDNLKYINLVNLR